MTSPGIYFRMKRICIKLIKAGMNLYVQDSSRQAISEKRKVWEDMLLVLENLGRPITEKQRNYFTRA